MSVATGRSGAGVGVKNVVGVQGVVVVQGCIKVLIAYSQQT